MELKRKRARIVVDLSVILTTVLDSMDARIIDLSEHGAQIAGAALPRGTRFQIEYSGQTAYAQCKWSEIDRMGVHFPFAIGDGPLHDALLMALPMQRDLSRPDVTDDATMPPPTNVGGQSGRRLTPASFGRRIAP